MKKEELRETLDRIRPSEELIGATMQKIRAQQEMSRKEKVSFWSTMNYRRITAVATCALVLGVGLVAWGQTGGHMVQDGAAGEQDYRLAEEQILHSDMDSLGNEEQSAFAQMDTSYEQWALLKGTVLSCRFLEVLPEDVAKGIKPQAILEFDLQEVLDRTEQCAIGDADTIRVMADFADEQRLNELVNSMGSNISIQIIPVENQEEAAWEIADYFIE